MEERCTRARKERAPRRDLFAGRRFEWRLRVVRKIPAAVAAALVQRSLRHRVLEQSLVVLGATRGKTPR
jgi:hypothetical protein